MTFSTDQKHRLLSRMGYAGPAGEEGMKNFLQTNPAAAKKFLAFDKAAATLSQPPTPAPAGPQGFAEGGAVDNLYQELYGRPVDDAGKAFWENQLASGYTMDQMRNTLSSQPEAQAYTQSQATPTPTVTPTPTPTPAATPVQTATYTAPQTTTTTVSDADRPDLAGDLETVYQQLYGRSIDPEGLEFWTNQIKSGSATIEDLQRLGSQTPEAQQYAATGTPTTTTTTGTTPAETTPTVDYSSVSDITTLPDYNTLSTMYSKYYGADKPLDPEGAKFWQQQLDAGFKPEEMERIFKETSEGVAYTSKITTDINDAFREVLGRTPVGDEINSWLKFFRDGGNIETAKADIRAQYAGDDFISQYKKLYGREPTVEEVKEFEESGVNIPEWVTEKEQLFTNTENQIVQAYRDLFGRNPDQAGLDFYMNEFRKGTPLVDILNMLSDSDERQTVEYTDFQMNQDLLNAQKKMVADAYSNPQANVTTANVAQMTETPETIIDPATGQVTGSPQIDPSLIQGAATATAPGQGATSTYDSTSAAGQVGAETAGLQAAQGQVSQGAMAQGAQGTLPPSAMAQGAQGTLSQGAMAQGAQGQLAQGVAAQGTLSQGAVAQAGGFDPSRIGKVNAGSLTVNSNQLVQAAGTTAAAITAQIAQSLGVTSAVAAQGTVTVDQLPQPAQIAEAEMAQASAIVSGGQLSLDAQAVAAKLASFSVDNGTLAEAVQGNVTAQDTVQGQLSQLMQQFNDGTPAWAAGAIRAANSAMVARGLGSSSMAGAAIYQAAMESALPIAAQDAQAFLQMNLANTDRRQQVALVNAAAQQGLSLQNLTNEQQVSLQNSMNAFQLQSQDLSAVQQTVIANAQIKASLQGQNLSNRQQSNMAVAARFAEMANLNLNNRQQTALQNNSNSLNVELANLSNRQQTYLANAQLAASLQGQVISNQQQAAMQNAARFSEAANITFSAQQQAALHNSELMKTVGLAELNFKQATVLQNAANYASMDATNLANRQQTSTQNTANLAQLYMSNQANAQQAGLQNASIVAGMDAANLANRQQAGLQNAAAATGMSMANLSNLQQANIENAKGFLQMDLSNLNNAQQTTLFKSQQNIQAILSDQSASNAAKQFNASSQNQSDQFYSSLQESVSRFNATQVNAINKSNVDAENTAKQFNAQMEDMRDRFNATNSLVIAQSNAQWRQNISTINTAAQNDANMEAAKTANAFTGAALEQLWQRERDLMAFAFTSSESSLDREVQMLLADKQVALAEWQQGNAEDEAKGYMVTQLVSKAFDFGKALWS